MAADEQESPNPAEQLLDLLVYAPIGLLYEYEDVLPQLIERGRNQVKLAQVLGQMAMRKRQADSEGAETADADSLGDAPDDLAGEVLAFASTTLVKAAVEIGAMLGLSPDEQAPQAGSDEIEPRSVIDVDTVDSGDSVDSGLAIADYDELNAREIVGLLADLSPSELRAIRAHEEANRARKTILAKLDRLEA